MAQASKKRKTRHIFTILRICVAAGAIYFVFKGEDLGQLGRIFLGMNWFVFALAVCLYACCQFIFVFRWSLLLRTQRIHIGYWIALRLHFLGLFYNNCLPGSVGGDLLRAWYITHHTEKRLEAALSVFVDRAIGLGCTVVLAGLFYWLILSGRGDADFAISRNLSEQKSLYDYWWVLPAVFAAFTIVIAAIGSNKKGRSLLRRIYDLVRKKGIMIIKRLITAARLYCNKPFTLLAAIFLTFFIQSLAIISIWIVGKERGIDADLRYYLAFFPISWVIGTFPISIGGAGIVEGGLKVLFSKVPTVLKEHRVVPGLIQRGIWLIISLPGLIIHLKGAHLPADKGEIIIDSEQSSG